MSFWNKLLCAIGWHGPIWFGNESDLRSERTARFERTCSHCGAVWHGTQVYRADYRTLGGWERVK